MNINELIESNNGERTFFDGELIGAYFTVANLEKLCEEYHQHKNALAEIEKCEPVAKLGRWMIDKSTGTDILTLDNCNVIEGKYANYIMGLLQKEIDKVVGELENTSPQQREWVGLSDQQIQNLIINSDNYNKFQFIKSVEHTVKQINAPEKG